MNMSESNTNIT